MQKPLFVYLVHPMSGLPYEKVEEYYTPTKEKLESVGYFVMHPMCAKKYLRGKKFHPNGNEVGHPIVTAHAITRRDHWMVRKADIIFADLSNAPDKSIGSISEIATAYELGKHTVGVMDKQNVHEHAFMTEQFDIIFTNYDDAIEYLIKLIRGEY